MAVYVWGVDSAEIVTEDLLQCVQRYFGYPVFWGRYLVRVPGYSEGLTAQEISLIRRKGIKLLPIFNSFREAKGYSQGKFAANLAVHQAHDLGIPKGVPIFANIERNFIIDEEWIHGWTEEIIVSGYQSGIYNDPVTGGFSRAFCTAARENELVKTKTILWSAEPEREPSGSGNPPDYEPKVPVCGGNVLAWQYGRNVAVCPIDTNLADSRLVNILW